MKIIITLLLMLFSFLGAADSAFNKNRLSATVGWSASGSFEEPAYPRDYIFTYYMPTYFSVNWYGKEEHGAKIDYLAEHYRPTTYLSKYGVRVGYIYTPWYKDTYLKRFNFTTSLGIEADSLSNALSFSEEIDWIVFEVEPFPYATWLVHLSTYAKFGGLYFRAIPSTTQVSGSYGIILSLEIVLKELK